MLKMLCCVPLFDLGDGVGVPQRETVELQNRQNMGGFVSCICWYGVVCVSSVM